MTILLRHAFLSRGLRQVWHSPHRRYPGYGPHPDAQRRVAETSHLRHVGRSVVGHLLQVVPWTRWQMQAAMGQ